MKTNEITGKFTAEELKQLERVKYLHQHLTDQETGMGLSTSEHNEYEEICKSLKNILPLNP